VALNGGPEFAFTPAISFVVNCETQEEPAGLWVSLSEGGTEGGCGWLEDRFGVSWQIVPTVLGELLIDPDPERSQRVMRAMLEMGKLDIAELERAARAAEFGRATPPTAQIAIANLPRERSSPTNLRACGSSSNVNVRVIGTLSVPSAAICTMRANASGSEWPITFDATTPRAASMSRSAPPTVEAVRPTLLTRSVRAANPSSE